ncbi:MAG: four helix bundle protein [Bacteroidales bacterium]
MIEKFEDLNVWQESVQLSIELYSLLKDCKDYSLRDQIQRSSISIASNIAEGFERTNKEFIARGHEILYQEITVSLNQNYYSRLNIFQDAGETRIVSPAFRMRFLSHK